MGTTAIIAAQLAFRALLIATLTPGSYGRLALVLSIYNTVMILGISGLPDSAARYIAISPPEEDPLIVRSAVRAAVTPTCLACLVVGLAVAPILRSPVAPLLAIPGLAGLIYSLLALGILRGRGHMMAAAAIMPLAAVSEVALLGALLLSGAAIDPLIAFIVFCAGNLISAAMGFFFLARTRPRIAEGDTQERRTTTAPTSREMLGFSLWLTLATIGVATMPLIMRFAAALDSYRTVAMVDVALVLLSLPQRVGSVIVSAVVPEASRAERNGERQKVISLGEHILAIGPFMLVALLVAWTPAVRWIFDALGKAQYSHSAGYLALALLAGPARIFYGLAQGVLVAQGQGRFLAYSSLLVTVAASACIFSATALHHTLVAFVAFVAACWIVYLLSVHRISRRPSSSRAAHASYRLSGSRQRL
jgi:O-antigen/teichoic acid export membrane protein